jgi:lipocalin
MFMVDESAELELCRRRQQRPNRTDDLTSRRSSSLIAKNMFKLLSFASLVAYTSASPVNTTVTGRIDTVDELVVDSYLGYWYTMYTNKLTDTITFKGGQCATAIYTLQEDGNIGVVNYETIGEKTDGSTGTDTIEGYAYVPNPAEPGQLMVVLDGVDHAAPYWVAALGPVNADKLYDYSLVSDNTGSFLFVLARNVDDFNAKYDEEIQNIMKDLGFTGTFKAPYSMYQGPDCLYNTA